MAKAFGASACGFGQRLGESGVDEEGVDELREWIANGRARYRELGGREILGFGLFLFER